MLSELHCGDCVDIMADMESEMIDLTITSPPYDDLRTYNGYTFDFEAIAHGLYRVTKQGGVVVWVVGDRNINWSETGTSFRQALGFMDIGFKLFDTMIYQKKNPNTGATGERGYHQAFEYMFVFSKGQIQTKNFLKDKPNKRVGLTKGIGGRRENGKRDVGNNISVLQKFGRRTNIWEYTIGGGVSTKDKIAFDHPAIFPDKLAEDHILSWSNEGDLVFDPMMGSGTTGKMALINRRRFIGVDISQEYVDIAKERTSNLTVNMF